METGHLFNAVIDLPKSAYFFTLRVTFWQAFFSILSVFFVAIDTAIEDIIMSISHNLKRKIENLTVKFGGLFCPQMACA